MGSISNHQNQNQNQNQQDTTSTNNEVAILMVPLAAQGHLNQLLQLSCLIISSYKLPVFYVTSPIFNRQAKTRINGLDPNDVARINFHDIPTPPFTSPPPDPNSPHKFPTQLQPAWYASLNMREPFAAFLKTTSEKFKRVVVIHDPMMAVVVQDVTKISNAESYMFNCISAASHVSIVWPGLQHPLSIQFPQELPSFEGCIPDDVKDFVSLQGEPSNYRAGDIYNTCRQIEAPYMDILGNREIAGNRKVWAIGPILPTNLSSDKHHKCLEWLDKHGPKSVIYVSFGTTVSLQDEQIKELALGLEQSKTKFLWVLRDADKADVFDGHVRRAELPEGYEDRVREVGLVVRDWAPQPQILAHKSVGGFMSHCGWNSCIESITMGVPIAAWPMHSDQPANTVFITEILKMGVVVKEWKQGMELVTASTIANAVKRLMASEEGDEVWKRAAEVSDIVRQAAREGGTSRLELDSFIEHISRTE